jgi:hypothetical protein
MPTVYSGDVDTIKRLFDNGTLFPRVTDSSDREMLRRNVLSLEMVIPSFETLQENLHYVGLAAKILIRHVVDELLKLLASLRSSVARPFATLRGASFLSPAPGNFPVPLRRTIRVRVEYGRDEAPISVRRPTPST